MTVAYKKLARGASMSKPPKLETPVAPLPQEQSEAVSSRPPTRSYRLSTLLHEESGHRLDELHLKLRRSERRRVKLAEVLERAIRALERELEGA